jgi:hypothetical protein
MFVALLFSAALMADPPAAGAPTPGPTVSPVQVAGAAKAKVAAVDPERVCKLEPVLGSKITKKVCYNRGQLAERTFYDKQNLDLLQAQTPGPFSR